jgi:spore coat polysaccharide biosynthesis predicted glycosyltransferase SpsG
MNCSFIILTELGYGVGLGHYTRTRALYETLLEKNEIGVMYVNQVNDSKLYPYAINCNWLQDLNFLDKHNPNIKVIIDSYLMDTDFLKLASIKYKNIVILDDFNRIDYENVKLIINPNVYFSDINYNNQSVKVLGGSNFVILRKSFTQLSQYSTKNSEKLKILLTIGGSDYRNIVPKLIEIILNNTNHELVVISPEVLKSNFDCNRLKLFKILDEQEMYYQMQYCDIAISACGQTLHELASVGIPTIGISIDFDQKFNQKYYHTENIIPNIINWDDQDLEHKILLDIKKYELKELREKVSKKALTLVNRNGTDNIVELIKSLQ